jgi:hypothetical protein
MVESKARESAPVGEKRPRETRKERRQRGKEQEKGQAYAVTAPVAANKTAFSGNCHNCGKPGHMKVNCTEKKPAGSGRKPGAVCNFCKKMDSHTEDECWEKNPHLKPKKWRKRDAEAKPTYATKTLEPSAPRATEMEQSGFTAWTVATATNCPREAFAVFADEGPELRPTTMEQRDTTPAARAKGEAERRAARAKEDRVRLRGPPPGFRPQGERRAKEVPESPPAAPETGRRREQPAIAAPVAAARALPPGFGEYAPADLRYVGLAESEQSGVRVELLSAPVTGPVQGEVVQRRPPTDFMVDVEREDPDNPDPVEIEREAMLILLGAIAAKEGPREGGEDAGGPGTAASVTPQVAHGGAKDAGGPEEAAGGTDQPSEKDGEEAGGEEAGAGGEDPSPEENPTAEGGGNNIGAGEASAGGGGSDGEGGSGDGSGDESGGDGDAEMAMDVEHATVELNEKGECKRDPEFWAPPLKLPDGGAVYIERFNEAMDKGYAAGTSPTADKVVGPPVFLKPRKVSGRLHPARWAQMYHTGAKNFLMCLGQLYLRICTRESPTDPAKLAVWQSKALYIQQAALGCFASYQEDLKLRQVQARQKGNKVASDLLEAFEFYRRALLPPATNTPATQNDGTNPHDSVVFPNPAMEKEGQGKSQLQADGHWQAHVIERFGTDWVGPLGEDGPVKLLTPAEWAQRAWRLEPPPEGAPEDVPPSETSGEKGKGKVGAAKKGKVTPEALQEAVAKTAVRQALRRGASPEGTAASSVGRGASSWGGVRSKVEKEAPKESRARERGPERGSVPLS